MKKFLITLLLILFSISSTTAFAAFQNLPTSPGASGREEGWELWEGAEDWGTLQENDQGGTWYQNGRTQTPATCNESTSKAGWSDEQARDGNYSFLFWNNVDAECLNARRTNVEMQSETRLGANNTTVTKWIGWSDYVTCDSFCEGDDAPGGSADHYLCDEDSGAQQFGIAYHSANTYDSGSGCSSLQPANGLVMLLRDSGKNIVLSFDDYILDGVSQGAATSNITDPDFDRVISCGTWIDHVFTVRWNDFNNDANNGYVKYYRNGELLYNLGPEDVGVRMCTGSRGYTQFQVYGILDNIDRDFTAYMDEYRVRYSLGSGVDDHEYAEVAPTIRPVNPTFDVACDAGDCINPNETDVDASTSQTVEVDDTAYAEIPDTDGQDVFSLRYVDWQFCESANCDGGGDPIQSAYDQSAATTTWVITNSNMETSTTYYVRARFASWAGDIDRDLDTNDASSDYCSGSPADYCDDGDVYDSGWTVMSFTTGGTPSGGAGALYILQDIGTGGIQIGPTIP